VRREERSRKTCSRWSARTWGGRIESAVSDRSVGTWRPMRVMIESALRVTQVLESSRDLRSWRPLRTNWPSESPFVIDVPWARAPGTELYQLRFWAGREILRMPPTSQQPVGRVCPQRAASQLKWWIGPYVSSDALGHGANAEKLAKIAKMGIFTSWSWQQQSWPTRARASWIG